MKRAALPALGCALMALTLAGLARTLSQMRTAEGRAAAELSRRIAEERAAEDEARRAAIAREPTRAPGNLRRLADLQSSFPGQAAAPESLERELKALEHAWEDLDSDPAKVSRRKLAASRFRLLFQQALMLTTHDEEAARARLEEAIRELLRWDELERASTVR